MGGHAAGEVASHIFVDTVQEVLDGASNIDELALKNAVLKANDEILQKVSVHPEYAGMGTTATLFHADVDVCVFAHVGDSRLYHIHDGKITQLTKDHSFVQDLIEKGKITPEEARNHPKRNMLMRAVGVEENLKVDTGRFGTSDGDIVLLCTDGLYTVVSDEDICRILTEETSQDKAALLVKAALDAGSRDNITAVVVDYHA
jgi:protein phosphatase